MLYNQPYGVSDTNAPYINGDPDTGQQGSIPSAQSIEYPQREIVSLVKLAGFTPTNADLQQVPRSVRQGINYYVAAQQSGPNVLACANSALPLDSYRPGLRINVQIPADNTDVVTLSIDGLGFLPIVRGNGAQLAASDLRAGMVAGLICDGTKFQIENFLGFTSTTTNNNTYVVNIPFCHDASAVPNIVTAPFAPAITALADGLMIEVKLANDITGPSTITVNALASHPIVRGDGVATGILDGVAGEILILIYDVTTSSFQIANRIAASAANLAHGRCYFAASGGNLVLSPVNGNGLIIGNASFPIPAGGLSIPSGNLALNTFTYIYAYMSGATMALETSTTGHGPSALNGVEVKNGDTSRTLVGAAYNTGSQLFAISWFNRKPKQTTAILVPDVSTYTTVWAESDPSIRNRFINWAGDVVHYNGFGSFHADISGGQLACALGFDGSLTPEIYTTGETSSTNSGAEVFALAGSKDTMSEGFHYGTLLMLTNGPAYGGYGGGIFGSTGVVTQGGLRTSNRPAGIMITIQG
jgi:hypothetical protein